MAQSPVSLNDLAKHLGLSQMTVSRVINGTGKASADTTARVLAAAEALGYRRNVFASINASKRGAAGTRQVVIDWIAEPPETPSAFSFYSVIMLQLLAGLEALGCATTVTDLTRQGEQRVGDLVGADLIIFCSPVSTDVRDLVSRFARSTPRIGLFQDLPSAWSVNPDDEQGGRLAAEHLHAQGHRHVAVYHTPDQVSQAARCASFSHHLRRLVPDVRIELLSYALQADGVTATRDEMQQPLVARWKQGEALPSAIFCPGGFATFTLYRFLHARAVAIPQQLAVLGYDMLPFYDAIETPLDHVGFGLDQIVGETVALADRILRRDSTVAVTGMVTVACQLYDVGSVSVSHETSHVLSPT